MTDTVELKKIIQDRGVKMKAICEKAGMTYATLNRKINNESEFFASEIMAVCDVLNLTLEQKENIFFKN